MTAADGAGWRPGSGPAASPATAALAAPADVRVVMDLRPLQDPERAPLTATYLEALLDALDADPRPGESYSFLLAADLDDPTGAGRTSRSSATAGSRRPASSGRAP